MEIVSAVVCYLIRDNQVLMIRGVKPYAPHYGRYNGLGGKFKPEDNNDPIRCCQREVEEESGYTVAAEDLVYCGYIRFTGMFPGKEWLVHFYSCHQFTGQQKEDSSQGSLMWANVTADGLLDVPTLGGDKHFLPWVFSGRRFEAHFEYNDREYVGHSVRFLDEP